MLNSIYKERMMNLNSYFSKINHHNPIVFNSVLWVFAYVILLFSFTQNPPAKIDYIYTGCFLVTIIIPVMINMYMLIPKFLKQERYTLYLMLFVSNLILFTQLNTWFFSHFIDYIFPDYYFISYHSNTKLISIFSIFLISTTLIKLSEDWFYFNRNENRELKQRNQHIRSQLVALRSQINPHFLFNALNVIYALAVENKDNAKDAIVQLSDILRYIIYDSNTEKITLKDEVTLLKKYVEFQKLRQHESKNITFEANVQDDSFGIYPMLLLPLVENSFKHGIKGAVENTFVNIRVAQNDTTFEFYIENNYSEDHEYNHQSDSVPKVFGIGIENIKKNLEIVYPETHTLDIQKTTHKFAVTLKLFSHEN